MSSGPGTLDLPRPAAGRSRRRLLRAGAVAAVVLVIALPAAGDTPPERVRSLQSQPAAAKLPPFGGDYQDQAIESQQTTAEVRKAKVHFVFPDVYLRAEVVSCFASLDGDSYFGGDLEQKSCSQLFRLPLPAAYQRPLTLSGGVANAYLVTQHGKNALNTYGSFPPVKVQALVFGSVPVSATVHLSQTATDGYLDPITARYGAITNVGPESSGDRIFPGFPPVPQLPDDQPVVDLTFKDSIDATLQLQLSDVAVDGQPVEVGPTCRTVSPVRLTVREALGYSVAAGYKPPKVRGLPGGFLPLEAQPGQHPGYFDGTADVPAFTQCGSATENLDPLLTALISSPSNSVSAYLPTGALSDYYCTSAIADSSCSPALAASQRRRRAVAVAIAAHERPATIRRLQAELKPSDYVMPRVKADGGS